MQTVRLCGRCGAKLAGTGQGGLCPKCFLQEGLRQDGGPTKVDALGPAPPQPTLKVDLPDAGDEALGTRISHYKLLERVGEGGCGVVYVAEQSEPVRRRVALKIIKLGMDTKQVVARFEAERQALAMMDHPNIAKVLDGGSTDTGRPYFVMELVKGIRITDYCDQNNLSTAARLDLFIQLCHAIQHAHQKGIIHRDIKPSNVMITLYDGRAVPKVIDFGIAKATEQKLTERTLFTQYGTMVGTLEYMSPEQAEMSALGVDTRSDIYSLGVLLYELLTGTTPLSVKRMKEVAFAEILRLIKEEEPPKPSTRLSDSGEALASISALRHTDPTRLTQLMRGELDWIVMKTLEKDRNRRYETANGFAADLQRYLNDEPVLACPPSASYRFRKFARRYRVAITMFGIVSGALILGLAGTAWQAIRASRELTRAVAAEALAQNRLTSEVLARQEADNQRRIAENKSIEAAHNLREARKAVDDWFTTISQTTLLEAPGLLPLRMQLLEAAASYYQNLLAQSGDNPDLRVDLAAAHMRLSVIYISLDRNDDSVTEMFQGLQLVEQLIHERPDDAAFPRRLAGYFKTNRFLYQGSRAPTDPNKAIGILHRSIELWEKFADTNPGMPEFRSDIAGMYLLLSAIYQGSDAEKSLSYGIRSCGILEKLIQVAPSTASYQDLYRLSLNDNAYLLSKMGREKEGEAIFLRAIQFFDALKQKHPAEPSLLLSIASFHHEMAYRLRNSQPSGSEVSYRQAIQILEELIVQSPMNAGAREQLRTTVKNFAALLQSQGRKEESETLSAKAATINEKLVIDFPDSPEFRLELAKRYVASAKQLHDSHPQEAVRLCQLALSLQEKLVADFPNQGRYMEVLTGNQTQLISLLQSGKQFADLEQFYRRIIALVETTQERSSGARAKLAGFHNELGILLRNTGKRSEAEVELRKAQELWRQNGSAEVDQAKKLAESEPDNHHRWHSLFYASYKAGDWENCLRAIRKKQEVTPESEWEWFYEAMAHWQLDHQEEGPSKYLAAIDGMARRDPQKNSRIERLREYQAKASILLGLPDPEPRVEQAWSYFRKGVALDEAGKKAEAEEAFSHSADVYESLAADFPGVLAYTEKLVDLLAKCGRKQELERVCRRAIGNRELPPGISPRFRLDHSVNCNELAMVLLACGRHEEAEEFMRNAIQLRLALANEIPSDSMYSFHLAHSYFGLALVLTEPSREAERVKAITEAGSLFSQLAADESATADFRQRSAHALWRVGDNWIMLNRFDEGQQAYEQSLATFQQLEVSNPAKPFYRQEQGFSHRRLAEVAERAGRMDDAKKHLRAAVAIYSRLSDEAPDSEFYRGEAAYIQKAFGNLLLRVGKLPEDDAAMEEFLRLQPEMAGPVAAQCLDLARKRLDAGDSVAAQPLFDRAIRTCKQALAKSPDDVELKSQFATTLSYQGVLYAKLKLLDQSVASYKKALGLWNQLSEQMPANEWYRQEWAYFSLGMANVLRRTDQIEDAVEHSRTCVRLNEQLVADFSDKPHHRERLAQGRGMLIALLLSLDRTVEAKTEMESLLKGSASDLNNAAWPVVRRPGAPADMARLATDMAQKAVELSPSAGHIWNTLGIAHYRAGEWQESIAALLKSAELRNGGDSSDWFFLAMAHWHLDQKEEARTWLSKAIEWNEANAKNNDELRGFRVEAETLIDTAKLP